MIVTITLNPAVDISYKLEQFSLDTVNRVDSVSKTAGGKGLNVARVLSQLGEEVMASGFLGGSLGNFIRSEVEKLAIQDRFVEIEGETRNCFAIIHEGLQTEILEAGPVISEREARMFLVEFTEIVKEVDIITLSGSLPKGLPTNFYTEMVRVATEFDTRVLVDTSGSLLTAILTSETKPYFIKPNDEELAAILGEEKMNETQIIDSLRLPLFENIPWIVVTLGAAGAIIKFEEHIYRVQLPKIKAVNPVGSGDSVVAGFAAGFARGLTEEALIKYGISMGVLNAMEEKTGYIDCTKLDGVVEQIQVEKLR